MSQLETRLWQDVMGFLKTRHPEICRRWFDELIPVTMETGVLSVHAPDSVQERYLQSRCREQFQEAAQASTGNLIAVRFSSAPPPPLQIAPPASPTPSTLNHDPESALPSTESGRHDGSNLQAETDAVSIPPVVMPDALGAMGAMPVPNRKAGGAGGVDGADDFRHGVLPGGQALSPDYTFRAFVSGPNNDIALAAATAVADQPGGPYNPLFIHGGVGLGKTHLLQAICRQVLSQRPGFGILYVSCDQFKNDLIRAVSDGARDAFRHQYRNVDLLVIDDIHFLGERELTQEEFFHTFNELHQTGRQIVLSSDAAPKDIPELEDRLVSRFQSGLIAPITPPNFETRAAIFRSKAHLRGLNLPDDVVDLVASRIDSHTRELEGKLNELQHRATLDRCPIDLRLAKVVLGEPLAPERSGRATLDHVVRVVTEHYQVRLQDLQSRRRTRSITEPRQICMYFMRNETNMSLEEIGGHFGGRDHSTVLHAVRTVDNRRETEPSFAQLLTTLGDRIRHSSSA